MFHLLAFFKTLPNPATLPIAQLAAVSDGVFKTKNGHFVLEEDLSLFAGFALASSLKQARFWTPSLEAVARPNVRPFNNATEVPNDPNLANWMDKPFPLRCGEQLATEAANTLADKDTYILLWVARRLIEAPPGPAFTVRGTLSGTIAGTAGTWSDPVTGIVWERTLRPGRYAVIGSEVYGEGGTLAEQHLAHRWIFANQAFRPGAISSAGNTTASTARTHEIFYDGNLGLWGTFEAPSMPSLQVMRSQVGTGTPTTTIYLTVVRL